MRIGLLIYGSIETVSGGYLYNRQLVSYLESQGDRVEIISLPYRDYWQHLGDNLSGRLLMRLLRLDVDVLIQDEMNYPSLVWLNQRLHGRVNYPIVSLIHLLSLTDSSERRRMILHRLLETRYLRRVDGYICTSFTTLDDVVQRFGIHKPAVVAQPGGDRFVEQVDVRTIVERGGSQPLRLLYVGNVIRRKGLHVVLEAMRGLDGVVLTVVGPLSAEPSYTTDLFKLVSQYKLNHRVHFLGALDGAALARHYVNSHLFVMPSSYESFGIVYLEAQQFGLPVIGTTAGAAGELISDQENGFLIAPGDAIQLAACLALLRDNRPKLIEMSQAARQRYAEHSTWEVSMARVRDFLQNAAILH